jgi:hypothetical protein
MTETVVVRTLATWAVVLLLVQIVAPLFLPEVAQ